MRPAISFLNRHEDRFQITYMQFDDWRYWTRQSKGLVIDGDCKNDRRGRSLNEIRRITPPKNRMNILFVKSGVEVSDMLIGN